MGGRGRRVIVIGSGAAGLTAALEASRGHDVVLLTKGSLGESNSLYAQGGVAAALTADDSPAAHLADTLAAGAGACDADAARILCSEGPASIRRLIGLGIEFDRDGHDLARGREAAHSVARVLHAGGDATGRAIVATLVRAVRASGVRVVEHAFVVDLVLRDGAVCGVETLQGGRRLRVEAESVIIASGGAGQLYRHTTNPSGATGDGVAAALQAGARLADTEFYQFHPTALAVPGTPLVSEAVRGDGATLLDARGIRFMPAVHPDAELAPRDVVARAIAEVMSGQGGEPVLLDATAMGRSELRRRFPGFWALCAAHGLDPAAEPVPVTPAAHYWMGGIAVDDRGRTSVPGLFAVGEAACTGAHGANRLASNSLLEALVFAHRAARALGGPWPVTAPVAEPAVAEPAAADSPGSVVVTRAELQQLMWRRVGLVRAAAGLEIAAETLASWRAPAGTTVEHLETANLLQLARVVVAAAAERTASLGAHYRSDDPRGDAASALELAHAAH